MLILQRCFFIFHQKKIPGMPGDTQEFPRVAVLCFLSFSLNLFDFISFFEFLWV